MSKAIEAKLKQIGWTCGRFGRRNHFNGYAIWDNEHARRATGQTLAIAYNKVKSEVEAAIAHQKMEAWNKKVQPR